MSWNVKEHHGSEKSIVVKDVPAIMRWEVLRNRDIFTPFPYRRKWYRRCLLSIWREMKIGGKVVYKDATIGGQYNSAG
jgi:hypothetical protein